MFHFAPEKKKPLSFSSSLWKYAKSTDKQLEERQIGFQAKINKKERKSSWEEDDHKTQITLKKRIDDLTFLNA